MDEVGTSITHSPSPNVCVCPLLILSKDKTIPPYALSLMWPLQQIHEGQEITRNFLPGLHAGPLRDLRLCAFLTDDAITDPAVAQVSFLHSFLIESNSSRPSFIHSFTHSLIHSFTHSFRITYHSHATYNPFSVGRLSRKHVWWRSRTLHRHHHLLQVPPR